MKKYKIDYRVETEIQAKGKPIQEIIYIGDYYNLEISDDDYKKTKKIQSFFVLLIVAFYILGGLVNNDGSWEFYVMLPYVCLFLPIAYLIMGFIGIINMPSIMERATYDQSVDRMVKTSKIVKWISSYVLIADLLFMLINIQNIAWIREIVFLCIVFVLFIQAFMLNVECQNLASKINIEKRKGKI